MNKIFLAKSWLRRCTLVMSALLGASALAYAQAPANDECASAIALTPAATCTATNGTTVGATQSLAAIACGGSTGTADDDVWYKFVAVSTSQTITVAGSTTFDAVVDVRSGTCPGTNIGCADATFAGGVETVTQTGLTVGSTYYVRVYTYSADAADEGTFTICVTSVTVPVGLAGDDCATAGLLVSGATCTPTTGTTVGATQSLPSISCSGFTGTADDDVWYSFVATSAGQKVTVVGSSNFDAVVDVRSGTCPGTNIGCSDVTGSGGTETVSLTGLTVGSTYYVRVYSYGSGTTTRGTFTICITAAASCASPTSVTVGSITTNSAQATFTATTGVANYIATLTPAGGTTTTITPAPTSSPISLTGLTQGTTYTFTLQAICSGNGAGAVLTTTFTTLSPPPTNNDCATAIALTPTVTCNPTSGTTVGATQSLAAITCGSFTGTADDDVWYSFVANSTIPIVTVVGSSNFDAVVDVRSGTCPGTNIGCADVTASGGTETVNLTGLTVGSTYYVRVYSYGSGTTSAGTFTICITGAPCIAPTNLVASGTTTSGTTLTFTPATGVSNYILTYTTAAGSTQTTAGTGSPITLTNLQPNTTYTASLVSDCGNTQTSTPITTTFTTQALACTPVTNLTVYNITATGASYLFTGATAGTSYTITYTPQGGAAQTQTTISSPGTLPGLLPGTLYTLSVVSNCSGNPTPTSAAATTTFTTIGTAAPTNVVVSNVTDTGATVTFTPPANATSYTVTYTPQGGTPVTITATGSPVTLTGLTGSTTYTVSVVANFASGSSTPATATFTTLAPAAPAPTNVAVSNVTDTGATVTFTAPANATGYTVTYTPQGGTPVTITATASPVVLTGLTASTVYSVMVVANYATGSSSAASTSFTTLAPVVPAPTNVTVTDITATSATITFTPAANATSYTITAMSLGGTPATITVTGSPVSLTGLNPSTTYGVVVVANYAGGVTSSPATASFTTLGTPVPTAVVVSDITDTSATITFTAPANATSYTVTYTPQGGTPITITATASPVVLTGLDPLTTYNVTLVANYPGGASSNPAAATFTTTAGAAPAPTNVLVTNITNTGATINFTLQNNATGYTVTYTPQGGTAVTVTATGAPVVLTGLASGTTYTVTVVATYAGGSSSPTVTTFVTTGVLATRATLAGGQMYVYPNPAHQTFTLSLPSLGATRTAQLEVVNTLGQTVSQRTISLTAGGTQSQVDISELATGVYSIHVQAGDQTAVTRLVVR